MTQDAVQRPLVAWIKARLKKDGKTIAWLSEAVNVDKSSLSRALGMKRSLKLEEVARIARCLEEIPPLWGFAEFSSATCRLAASDEAPRPPLPLWSAGESFLIQNGPRAGEYAVCHPGPLGDLAHGDIVVVALGSALCLRKVCVMNGVKLAHAFDCGSSCLDPEGSLDVVAKVAGFFSPA